VSILEKADAARNAVTALEATANGEIDAVQASLVVANAKIVELQKIIDADEPDPIPDPVTFTSVDNTDPAITWDAGWGSSTGAGKYLGGDRHVADTSQYGTLTFTATTGWTIRFRSAVASHHGMLGIRVDNGTEVLADEYSATRAEDQIVATLTGAAGTHTIKWRAQGSKNPASTGVTVAVDRLEVSGITLVTPTPPDPVPTDPTVPPTGFVHRLGQLVFGADGKRHQGVGFNSYVAQGCGNPNQRMTVAQCVAWIESLPKGTVIRFNSTAAGTGDIEAFAKYLEAARKSGAYLIPVLGDSLEHCGIADANGYAANGRKTAGWLTTGYKGPYLTNLTKWVTRFKDHPNIYCWELANEIDPLGGSIAAFKAWADDCAGKIKAIDKNHMVSIGTLAVYRFDTEPAYGNYKSVHSGPNIDILSLHEYDTDEVASNHLDEVKNAAKDLNKPYGIFEFGNFLPEQGKYYKPIGKVAGDTTGKYDAYTSDNACCAVVFWSWRQDYVGVAYHQLWYNATIAKQKALNTKFGV
jgi:hypothetical protein